MSAQSSPEPKRQLSVDMNLLSLVFEDAGGENEYYLDLETGEIIMVPGVTSRHDETDYEDDLYIAVPHGSSQDGYQDMEDFIDTVQDEKLRERLLQAISERGAFRHFKDVLLDYPQERERWFAFKDARLQQRIMRWLASENIEPIP